MYKNWVLKIQGNFYHTNNSIKSNGILDSNFSDAVIFGNLKEDEANILGKQLMSDCRCFWDMVEYETEKELVENNKFIYIGKTKYSICDRLHDFKDALKSMQEGKFVLCKCTESGNVLFRGTLPEKIKSELILNGSWYTIKEIDK